MTARGRRRAAASAALLLLAGCEYAYGAEHRAPELVVEIAASSASYDLHDKLDVYCRFGVQEYVVHRAENGEVDWFVRRDGRYERLAADAHGVFRSEVFPGLWLDPVPLLAADLPALRAVVERGTREPEHAPFAARLRGA